MLTTLRLLMIFAAAATCTEAHSTIYSAPFEYIFVTSKKTWYQAKADCETMKGVLVKISSDDVTRTIRDNYPSGHQQMWIGMTDADTEGEWKWLADGTTTFDQTYANWKSGQPDDWGNNEDCATVVNVAGSEEKWNDVSCSLTYAYICQKHKVFVGKNVLLFSYETKIWAEAKVQCANQGMHLIKIDSDALTTAVKDNYGQDTSGNGWKWIGADDIDQESDWRWLDGTSASRSTASYYKWNDSPPQEPNGGIRENCAIVDSNGGWIDLDCSRKRKYICQQDEIYFTDQHQLYFSTGYVTWEQAKADCVKSNSNLIKIDSASLTDVIKAKSQEKRWIGASDAENEGQWKWLDGTSAIRSSRVYTNWNIGEPNNGGSAEDCAVVLTSGRWNDVTCDSTKEKSICQKPLPTTISRNGRTFIFHRTEKVDWDEAKRLCRTQGSRLAEIYDKDTNDLIINNIIHSSAEFFCGGKLVGSTLSWDSGERASYTSGWAAGEGSNIQHDRIALSGVGWKDVQSSTSLPYICEMAIITAITIPIRELTIGEGTRVETVCSADGVPFSNVFWKFSSTKVEYESRYTLYQTKGNGSSVLHVANAILTDEGTYTCFAENQAGNFNKTLQKDFTLKVPSVPELATAEPVSCSPSVAIRWKANSKARGIPHKIIVRNSKNESERYEFPTSPNTIPNEDITFHVKEWMIYTVEVKPCPNGVCINNYAKTISTISPTMGRPGKASVLSVEPSHNYSCSFKWQPPVDHMAYISSYKVIIRKRLNYPQGSKVTEITKTVDKNQTSYLVEEKANMRYKFGIKTETCAGVGEILWSEESCVTDAKAPEEVTKPEILTNINSDGTSDVIIHVPSEENGPISCLFVIVKVLETSNNSSTNGYSSDYTLDDLIQANATTNAAEYVALALKLKSLTRKHKVTLGDGKTTSCEIFPFAQRKKRSADNNVFVGHNLKLDSSKSYSMFVATSFSINGRILLTASESVEVAAIQKPIRETNTDSGIPSWIIGVIAGSVILILLMFIGAYFKRKSKVNGCSDAVVQNKAATTSFGGGKIHNDDKTQGYEVIETRPKVETEGRNNPDPTYVEPIGLQKRNDNSSYEVVSNRYEATSVPTGGANAESPYAPYVLQLEESPEGYDAINIASWQDQPDHVYSKIPESQYEQIRVTGDASR